MNIIITGASKGLGKAIAEKFASGKNTLYLCARHEKDLEKTKQEILLQNNAAVIHYKTVDVSNKIEVKHFAQWILQQAGTIDILINNAGQFLPGNISDEQEGTLEQMIETNLYSAYYLTKALLPAFLKQRCGHIFNMCSIASLHAYNNGGSYSISKFALAGFSKNLREELKPHNIKVTSVFPGAVYTDSWAGSGVKEERIMKAKDIAELIYTASALSPQACVEELLIRPQQGDL